MGKDRDVSLGERVRRVIVGGEPVARRCFMMEGPRVDLGYYMGDFA